MDVILGQLGIVPKDLVIQFAIVVIFFLIANLVYFKKLQFVIEYREEQTNKLEGDSEKKIADAKNLSSKYKDIINVVHKDAQGLINEGKAEITRMETDSFKQVERETYKHMEEAQAKNKAEVEALKSEVFKESEKLSDALIQKLN